MTGQFYEEQFAASGLAPYGGRGRILFGFVRLEEHAANMAAAWLQGGWTDEELAEMLTAGVIGTIVECAEYIEHSCVVGNEEEGVFASTWQSFLEAMKRLEHPRDFNPRAIKSVLLLLPLTASALRSSIKSSLGLSSEGSSLVDPKFFRAIEVKAEELGCAVSTDSGTTETLKLVEVALRDHLALLG